jgi:antitoxin (DNA-binding transcriptional repressor) of toxin-antitoxin stability system
MQKKHLSRLVEKAARGESFIIAKAGKPMVKFVPINAEEQSQDSHFGFMDGLYEPDDFKTMGAAEIKREVCGDK